jgi:hypothetical protein
VGGGHYYAYIRPNGSVGMDYEAFAAHAYTDPHPDVHPHAPYGGQDAPTTAAANSTGDGHSGPDGSADADAHADMTEATRKSREAAALKRKEELDAAARNGQWLKFNDETVLKVKSEADI